jgi:VWFA-related protein
VNSVSIDVSVRNGNVPILGLSAGYFRLWDNNTPQTIESVSLGAVPIDATLFIDTSGSTAGQLEVLKADVRKIAEMLRPDDRLRVLSFDDQVHDIFGWQRPDSRLDLDGIKESAISSPVYDALLLAMLRRPEPDRRHLIVAITDGVDNGSLVSSATIRAVARRAEAVLHIVLIVPDFSNVPNAPPSRAAGRSRPDAESDSNLGEAATLTGGDLYRAPIVSFHERIVASFKKAFDDFRSSYVLRFTPTNVDLKGWHDLRVDVPGKATSRIRARRGYFGG